MNKGINENIITFKDRFDPSLVLKIMSSVDIGDKETVVNIIKKLPPSDIADIINLLKSTERKSFIDLIKDDFNPETLSVLDDVIREEIIKYLGYNFVANLELELFTVFPEIIAKLPTLKLSFKYL